MKKYKIIFWVATGIFSAMMLFSSYMYLGTDAIKAAFTHIGFPDYFRIELGIAKLVGAIALILPFVPGPAKVFAYVGFTINLISAVILHITLGDTFSSFFMLIFLSAMLAVSYFTWSKLQAQPVSAGR